MGEVAGEVGAAGDRDGVDGYRASLFATVACTRVCVCLTCTMQGTDENKKNIKYVQIVILSIST
jgi:hypothetical protein